MQEENELTLKPTLTEEQLREAVKQMQAGLHMNRAQRRRLLKARKHPANTRKYASPQGKKNAIADMNREKKERRIVQ